MGRITVTPATAREAAARLPLAGGMPAGETPVRGRPGLRLLAQATGLALAGLLGGCAVLDPAGWFHSQEGGVIAQQKGPLPGEGQPYPNLATVPPPPAPPNLAAMQQISNGLVADRAHARLLAEAAPLPDPSRPSTAPALFGVGSLPPPVPPPAGGTASASMAAVTAPPAPASAAPPRPAAPPAKAPVTPVQSAELPPATPAGPGASASSGSPAPTPTGSATSGATRSATPASTGAGASPSAAQAGTARTSAAGSGQSAAATAPSGPPPTIPAAPPPMPQVAQAGLAAAAPRARPAAPAAGAPPPTPVSGPAADRVTVAFAPGSAILPTGALPDLRALAARRGSRPIEALGQGAAASADPTAQLAATKLGLARAQAIAAALEAAGVPAVAIQLRSDASGTGGIARLE